MKGLIFTYLLTYGGAAAALFNPFVGLLVYVCFAILHPESLWPWAVPPGNYSRIVAIALIVGWVAKGFGSWRFGRARAVVALLGAFGAWTIVAANFAVVDREAAWKMAEELIKIIIPFFVGATTIDSVRKLRAFTWTIVLSEGYVALEFNLSYLGGYNRLWLEGFGYLDNNGNAVALVACVGMAFFLGLNERHWVLKALAFGASLLMTHAILFSLSRGGMVSLLITGFVAFVLMPKRPSYYVAFALGVLIILRLAGPQVVERFGMAFITGRGVEASADSRFNQWSAALTSIRQSPLGVGPDQWRYVGYQFGIPEGEAVHSTWMQVGAEMGLPGLLSLLSFYGVCMLRLWPLTREHTPVPDPWFRHLARMVITSLTGFMIAAQFVTLHKLEIPYFIVLIGVTLLKMAPAPSFGPPGILSGPAVPAPVAARPSGRNRRIPE